MKIADLSVKKLDHNDPIYPDVIDGRPFSDVYLLVATLEDGTEQHASFFVLADMTLDHASSMLKLFAKAIAGIQPAAKAA